MTSSVTPVSPSGPSASLTSTLRKNTSLSGLHVAALLTASKHRTGIGKFAMQAQPSLHVYKYRPLWRRLVFKIKVRQAMKKVNEDILVYGTTNELTDLNQQYKENIDQLIERKSKKQEAFRTVSAEGYDEKIVYSWLIHPDSRGKKLWNLLLMLLMIYTAIVMPFSIAFMDQVFWDEWTAMDLAIDGFFFLDMIVNFFSITQNDEGRMEVDRWTIAKTYLKSWFVLDLISCFPMTLVDYSTGNGSDDAPSRGKYNSMVKISRLPRMYKLLRIVRVLKLLKSYSKNPDFERFQDFLQINSRCLWFFSARLSEFSSDTWVVRLKLEDVDSTRQYLTAVYWAVTTAATVGYGDVTPLTPIEILLALTWMVIGVGFYSFTVGSLSSFLTSIDTRDSILSMKMAAIQEFSKQVGISHEVKSKIRDAVKYNTYKMGNIWSDKHSLFSELPKLLRQEVAWSMYEGIAKEFPVFSFFEGAFLAAVMPLLRPAKQGEGEYIYREGDYADEVFFITHGRINYVIVPEEIVYKSFLKGSYIGEIEIFRGVNRLDSALSCGECELLVLSKNDFTKIIAEFPAEAKRLRQIALEKANRNNQAHTETYELLRLKAAKGSLSELAGQQRIVKVDTEYDVGQSIMELVYEKTVEMREGVKENGAIVKDITGLLADTKQLIADALKKTSRLPFNRDTKRTSME